MRAAEKLELISHIGHELQSRLGYGEIVVDRHREGRERAPRATARGDPDFASETSLPDFD